MSGMGCDRCGHFWHGLRCEKEDYDHKYMVFICGCPPCWEDGDSVDKIDADET